MLIQDLGEEQESGRGRGGEGKRKVGKSRNYPSSPFRPVPY
jgi:hypothetical protein